MTCKVIIAKVELGWCNFKFMLLLSWQYSRNVSQTRWIIDDERMGEASVEVLSILANSCFLSVFPFNVDCGR